MNPISRERVAVFRHLLRSISREPHVKEVIYLDHELAFLQEGDARGISSLRTESGELIGGAYLELPHEEIIFKLEQASRTFDVLVLKTDITIPYTSVFIELRCRYWSEDAESRPQVAQAEACAERRVQ